MDHEHESTGSSGFIHVLLLNIVGVAAGVMAVAIVGAASYTQHAKTAEATRNLGAIETGEKSAYQRELDASGQGVGPFVHAFCPSSSHPVPKGVPAGKRVSPPSDAWSEASWVCLKFSINEPQWYQYATSSKGTGVDATYEAVARGDLDGDGVTSTFTLRGKGSPTGDATRTSFMIVNEDE